jgi:hypothetical protein
MPMDQRELSPLGRYRSDLRNVLGSSASAYGYTLTVWSTGMVLSHAYGPPNPPLVFSFFLGAVLAFAVVGVLAFGGVTVEFGGESRRVQLWGLSVRLGGVSGGDRVVVVVRAHAEPAGMALGGVRGHGHLPDRGRSRERRGGRGRGFTGLARTGYQCA